MSTNSPTRVVIAMSGGVDSSVAAALLKEQGYDVTGLMMHLWSEPGHAGENRCCTKDAMSTARGIAGQLGIPFYSVDARQVFHDTVVKYFINGYTQGTTPNPCLMCNRLIRWEFLLKQALALGADFMATGHYARLRAVDGQSLTTNHGALPNVGERVELLRGVDKHKDQSYVLHILNQEQLSHTLFPLGEYTKSQVRALARKFDLPVAERADSQDLCFVGAGSYQDFLLRNAPQVEKPGPILNTDSEQLGQHRGLAFYTIGQRRGLGIAAPYPLYVRRKDIVNNALIIDRKENLGRDELSAQDTNWIAGEAPNAPIRAQVKIRYKARLVWGRITPLENKHIHIKFETSIRDITPGQAAVFYDGDVCLGGGIIE
ncbi:MAG: tRNA 2-thiouridine(34) synthase MnmA [Chloroflexota bacterium]|nr:tRNA 2-thiouridine(34) synthase MnmA [Chloroflexota bacterium]